MRTKMKSELLLRNVAVNANINFEDTSTRSLFQLMATFGFSASIKKMIPMTLH